MSGQSTSTTKDKEIGDVVPEDYVSVKPSVIKFMDRINMSYYDIVYKLPFRFFDDWTIIRGKAKVQLDKRIDITIHSELTKDWIGKFNFKISESLELNWHSQCKKKRHNGSGIIDLEWMLWKHEDKMTTNNTCSYIPLPPIDKDQPEKTHYLTISGIESGDANPIRVLYDSTKDLPSTSGVASLPEPEMEVGRGKCEGGKGSVTGKGAEEEEAELLDLGSVEETLEELQIPLSNLDKDDILSSLMETKEA